MDPIVYSDKVKSVSGSALTSKLKDERNNIQIPFYKRSIEALASVKDSKRGSRVDDRTMQVYRMAVMYHDCLLILL